jgi:hypothetical protein
MKFPFREVVFDGGAVIELLLIGEDSSLFKNIAEEIIIPTTTDLAIVEAEYILCRKFGKEIAFEKVDNLLDSNYFNVVSLGSYRRKLSELKCFNPISLPDCNTIAIAVDLKIPALFARREKEITNQIGKKPFDTKIYFLEDFDIV